MPDYQAVLRNILTNIWGGYNKADRPTTGTGQPACKIIHNYGGKNHENGKETSGLVLTGVMAVSMLTGCALSDRAAANALEKALNSTSTQPEQKVVYNYDNDLNSKAEKAFESLGADAAARKAQLATAANKTALTYIKVGTKDYAYIVIGAPKTSDDSHAETDCSKLHGTSGVIYDTALKTVSEGALLTP